MQNARKKLDFQEQFFGIRLNSVAPSVPLSYDLYLAVNSRPILFRKKGDSLTPQRMKMLAGHGGDKFLVPEDQRAVYMGSLRDTIRNPDSSTDLKSRFIKESAFLHVHDLFTKNEIRPVVNEAKSLIADMVDFVSADMEAVVSLLRLSAHDYYTYNHCVDVAVYSIVLAKKVFGEDRDLLLTAGMGGLLHDIGKRKLDWNIINKTTSLTPAEWEEIKRHPLYGRDTLMEVNSISESTRLVVFEHHENFDGTGYPRGLEGDEISKLSRIVTIADVFDALTTDRSYHKAVPAAEALNIMFGMQGKFDPSIFNSFDRKFEKKDVILPNHFDPCTPQKVLPFVKK